MRSFRDDWEYFEYQLDDSDKRKLANLIDKCFEIGHTIGLTTGQGKKLEGNCSEEILNNKNYIVEKIEQYLDSDD
jgi:hypothetical protein